MRKTRVGIASGGHCSTRWLFAMEVKRPWADGKVAQGQHRKGHAGIAGADLGGVGAGMCLVFMVARTLAAAGLSLTDGLFRGEVVGRRVIPQLLAWNLPRAFPHLDFGAG